MTQNPKRILTDKFVRGLKPAERGKRVEHMDLQQPNFGVRVTDRGVKTYFVYARWSKGGSPSRRAIGTIDEHSLAEARDLAREWLKLAKRGIDPAEKKRQDKLEQQRAEMSTFLSVAEAWFHEVLRTQRKGLEVEQNVRNELIAKAGWGPRPITSITHRDIREVIKQKKTYSERNSTSTEKKGAPAQARNLLITIKSLFRYAVAQNVGLEISPAAALMSKDLIGFKKRGERVLDPIELHAFLLAARDTPYPYGPLLMMLMLTGQRRSEVGNARWREFDLANGLWIIPKERMKMDKENKVPITDDLSALLAELPRFNKGDHLFSTTFGERPVNAFSKAKKAFDKTLSEKLGFVPEEKWVIHDIRRTMRTGLAELPISDNVCERMIAHTKRGIEGVYNKYDYLKEKRHGFELWHQKLRDIINPPAGNVVSIR